MNYNTRPEIAEEPEPVYDEPIEGNLVRNAQETAKAAEKATAGAQEAEEVRHHCVKLAKAADAALNAWRRSYQGEDEKAESRGMQKALKDYDR